MVLLISGATVWFVTGLLFWRCLPDAGKYHRFVGTEWEPYISVALTSGAALGFTMMLAAVLNLLS